MDSVWSIKGEGTLNIFFLNLSVENRFDCVSVYLGQTLSSVHLSYTGTLVGSVLPQIYAPAGTALVRLTTDKSTNLEGFCLFYNFTMPVSPSPTPPAQHGGGYQPNIPQDYILYGVAALLLVCGLVVFVVLLRRCRRGPAKPPTQLQDLEPEVGRRSDRFDPDAPLPVEPSAQQAPPSRPRAASGGESDISRPRAPSGGDENAPPSTGPRGADPKPTPFRTSGVPVKPAAPLLAPPPSKASSAAALAPTPAARPASLAEPPAPAAPAKVSNVAMLSSVVAAYLPGPGASQSALRQLVFSPPVCLSIYKQFEPKQTTVMLLVENLSAATLLNVDASLEGCANLAADITCVESNADATWSIPENSAALQLTALEYLGGAGGDLNISGEVVGLAGTKPFKAAFVIPISVLDFMRPRPMVLGDVEQQWALHSHEQVVQMPRPQATALGLNTPASFMAWATDTFRFHSVSILGSEAIASSLVLLPGKQPTCIFHFNAKTLHLKVRTEDQALTQLVASSLTSFLGEIFI